MIFTVAFPLKDNMREYRINFNISPHHRALKKNVTKSEAMQFYFLLSIRLILIFISRTYFIYVEIKNNLVNIKELKPTLKFRRIIEKSFILFLQLQGTSLHKLVWTSEYPIHEMK